MVSLGQSSGKFHFPSRIEGKGVYMKFNVPKNENVFIDLKHVVLQSSGQTQKTGQGQTSVHIPDIFF